MVEQKILSFSMRSFGSVTFFPSIRSSFGTFEVVALPFRSFIWRHKYELFLFSDMDLVKEPFLADRMREVT